jgi:hypothetical protein
MGTILFNTFIRNSVSLQETQYQRADLMDYDNNSNALLDYTNFLDELEVVFSGD